MVLDKGKLHDEVELNSNRSGEMVYFRPRAIAPGKHVEWPSGPESWVDTESVEASGVRTSY